MDLIDVAKLLLVQEESSSTSLQKSIDKLTSAVIRPAQAVVAPTTTKATVGKLQYFTQTRENYITSGNLFTTTANVAFKVFKVETPDEWKTLSIYINKELYIQGDFAYYDKIGLSYYKPDTETYVFDLAGEQFQDGIKITIDSGTYINLFAVVGNVTVS